MFSHKIHANRIPPSLRLYCSLNPDREVNAVSFFQSLSSSSATSSLLSPSLTHADEFSEQVRNYVLQVMTWHISQSLTDIHMLAEWVAEAPPSGPDSASSFQFSFSPLEYITRTGDQLLSLLQQLESMSIADVGDASPQGYDYLSSLPSGASL